MKETSVPVEDQEEVVNERNESEDVGIVCVSLAPIHEGPKLVDLDQPEDPENGLEAERQVEKVERKETETVDVKRCRVHVVEAKLGGVHL
jgi:hypothetical protein